MNQEPTAPVRIGEILAEKYRVERVLGAGGMGVVIEAVHVELGQRVALKFMLPEAAANAAAVERFSREARASARLQSDNIVHVTDIGTLTSGEPFMVMEYLEGEDLGQILQASGPLGADDAIDYVLQACAGLAEAHATGIIHRDLKPANLFLARRADTVSVVKIVDFGISKVSIPGVAGKATNTRDLMGSPLYMSPEQLASSSDVDARTDIWSLGVILYELLTAAAPFEGDMLPQLCSAVMLATPPSILEKRPDLPAGLWEVVAKCLEKKPNDRYANVGQLADALAAFAPPQSSATLVRISRLAGNLPPTSAVRSSSPSERPHLELVVQPLGHTASSWTPDRTTPLVPRSPKRLWFAVAIVSALVGSGGAFALAHEGVTLRSLGAWRSAAASSTGAVASAVVPPQTGVPSPAEIATAAAVAIAPASAAPASPATTPGKVALPSRAAHAPRQLPAPVPATPVANPPTSESAWAIRLSPSEAAPSPAAASTALPVPGPYDEQ